MERDRASEAVVAALAQMGPEQSLSRIAERSGLPLAVTVRALAALRERGGLHEDLNVDSGEWHYSLVRKAGVAAPPAQKSLDDLLSELERKQR
jgi:hypothetical protein